MNNVQRDAIERIVETIEMASYIPEDVDLESPQMKALLEILPERNRNELLASASDPDIRKISSSFMKCGAKYWRNVHTAREDGRKIAFVPFNFIPEIFYALDMMPITVEVLTSIGQTLEEGILDYLDLSVERGLPDTMCSSHRGTIGMIEAGVMQKPDLIVNGAPGSCDPNSKAFEYMSEKFNIPALNFDIPYYHNKRGLDYFAGQFKKFVRGLEEFSGNKLDEDRLREIVKNSNKATELFMEINELKRNVPNPVPNIYNQHLVGAKLMAVGTPESVEFFQTALDISKDRFEKGKSVRPEERIRALFIYTNIYFDSFLSYWFQEEMGVSYLMDLISFLDFDPLIDTSSVDSMLYGLADELFNMPMGRQLKGGWDKPASWLSDVLYYARTYKADCCIFTGHLACKHAWGIYRLVSDTVKKEVGIPSLRMEGDGWDPRITSMPVIKEQFEEFFAGLV